MHRPLRIPSMPEMQKRISGILVLTLLGQLSFFSTYSIARVAGGTHSASSSAPTGSSPAEFVVK